MDESVVLVDFFRIFLSGLLVSGLIFSFPVLQLSMTDNTVPLDFFCWSIFLKRYNGKHIFFCFIIFIIVSNDL